MKVEAGKGRLLRGVTGLVLILIGIPLLVLPGPGLLLIGAGGWLLLRALGVASERTTTAGGTRGSPNSRSLTPPTKEVQ